MIRLLYVIGKNFGGGAVFEKKDGRWKMIDCSPYLRKAIGKTELPRIGNLLKTKGFEYWWVR